MLFTDFLSPYSSLDDEDLRPKIGSKELICNRHELYILLVLTLFFLYKPIWQTLV